jgi:type IV pilus assembly protein PilC
MKLNIFANRVTLKEMAIFTRQLAVLIEARLPILKSLDIIAKQIENIFFKNIIISVADKVKSGKTLAESVSAYPSVFDMFFISMVKVGETAGILDSTLLRLAIHFEKSNSLRRKLLQAMMYPIVILVVSIGAVIFLILVIVPTFAELFREFGSQLPSSTRAILAVSNIFTSYWYFIVFVVIGVYFSFNRYIKTQNGKENKDKFLLRIPLVGNLIKKNNIALFSRTIGILIGNGVQLIDALKTTKTMLKNTQFKKIIEQLIISVSKGESISKNLQKSELFPIMVSQMVSVGEETGELDKMFIKIAEFYEEELDTTIEGLSSIVEPIIIVSLGLIVGIILISMYMPMFELLNVIQQ